MNGDIGHTLDLTGDLHLDGGISQEVSLSFKYRLLMIFGTVWLVLFFHVPCLGVGLTQWNHEPWQTKDLPFTQPIPDAFGGGQYISSTHGQVIQRGDAVEHMARGYLRGVTLNEKTGRFTIRKTRLYDIDYFLSVKLVIDRTASVTQIVALAVNGNEIGKVTMTIVSSTPFIPDTTLETAIFTATAATTAYLQKGDRLELVLSEASTLPHWGDKKVRVFAEDEDLAASLFLQSEEVETSS